MASPSTNLHFILIPLMTQGHMIPTVDIARILAQRVATVTIVTTPVNASRFKSVIDRALGCENYDLLPSAAQSDNLFAAIDMLEEPAEKTLRGLSFAPSCIILDNGISWTTNVAKRLNIPRIIFFGPGCFSSLCINIAMNTNILYEIDSDFEYFVLPGLPDRIKITKPQASGWGKGKTEASIRRFERRQESRKGAYGIVVNSFEELEPKYVEAIRKVKDKKVWCIGPVSLCNKIFQDIAERGNKAAVDGNDCLKWLDTRETRSVVYVCFESLSHTSTDQAIELALGLELSNIPFIWFIKCPSIKLERWISEGGYEDRIKDRGLIVRGWAPQVLILSHQAIGGFITHYVLKIRVKIGIDVPVSYGKNDTGEVMVKREIITTAVQCLMNNEEEGIVRRKRAKELGEMAKRAMEEGLDAKKKTLKRHIGEYILFLVQSLIRWNKTLPIKINIYSWHLSLDRLPTRFNLDARRVDLNSLRCPICDGAIETSQYLFVECPVVDGLWNMVRLDVVIQTTLWIIWNFRNRTCFDSKPPRKDALIEEIKVFSIDGTRSSNTYGGHGADTSPTRPSAQNVLRNEAVRKASGKEYFVMPALPDQIELTNPQASTWGKGDSKETTEMFDRLLEAKKTLSGIVVNSFMELEPKYVKAFARAKDKKVWWIGLVSLSNKSFKDLSKRGNQPATNKLDCLKWLDSREKGSAVYVCLGSLWYGSAEQAIELGLGLESSNKPFIWFIRQTSDEFERWLLEEGYEERIKDRGLLVHGWAQQILILSHEAIGGFCNILRMELDS
nr:UDP-glycosyltransferase 73E1-like [Tanacetum cinerariifolium]